MSAQAPETADELDAVVGRALAKEPDRRHPSAGDLARAARAAAEGRPAPALEGSVAAGAARPAVADSKAATQAPATTPRHLRERLQKPAVVLALALGVLVVGLGVWGWVGTDGADDRRPQSSPPEQARARVSALVRGFARNSGPERCRLLTDALVDAYGGRDRCQRRLGRAIETELALEDVDVTGSAARVEATTQPTGNAFVFEIVRDASGVWRIAAVRAEGRP